MSNRGRPKVKDIEQMVALSIRVPRWLHEWLSKRSRTNSLASEARSLIEDRFWQSADFAECDHCDWVFQYREDSPYWRAKMKEAWEKHQEECEGKER